jgi:hypothetical protein
MIGCTRDVMLFRGLHVRDREKSYMLLVEFQAMEATEAFI